MRISDWSSDVCSSDLAEQAQCAGGDEIEADMTEPAVVSERLGDHRCEPAADDAAQIERHRGAGIAPARREQARQPAAERAVGEAHHATRPREPHPADDPRPTAPTRHAQKPHNTRYSQTPGP